jgi:hypothetical protein
LAWAFALLNTYAGFSLRARLCAYCGCGMTRCDSFTEPTLRLQQESTELSISTWRDGFSYCR